ncbi:MAG: ribose 5-phosphate isomerase B [Oscillospiraceae bacterium]|jgi:ribose 5-phosphate isomerase B|nr:ribose 5-phosphate isomerase B [Oscillospiraceae bacterium]
MIIIGSDHGGYELKEFLKQWLEKRNLPYIDCGCDGSSVDYPDIAEAVCRKVLKEPEDNRGVLICGTGIGVSVSANKIPGIRAALCTDYYSAKYTRKHNDSNVICLGGRTIGTELAAELLDIWLNTAFDGGRHALRVEKIKKLEEKPENE